MATYVIGDVQGCADAMHRLLSAIDFDAKRDHLVFAGDLIARGENSLAVMQWVLDHQDSCRAVLGNHDLNFLAVASGLKVVNNKDNTGSLLNASICDQVIDWYRSCQLVMDIEEHNVFIVHAGVWPGFDRKTLLTEVELVHKRLQSSQWVQSLAAMYGDEPNHFSQAKTDDEKARFLINSCTRMRFVEESSLNLDFTCKKAPEYAYQGLIAWMDVNGCQTFDRQILFGHWAALNGNRQNAALMALDTGCVWNGSLTAVRLEDRQLIKVSNEI